MQVDLKHMYHRTLILDKFFVWSLLTPQDCGEQRSKDYGKTSVTFNPTFSFNLANF